MLKQMTTVSVLILISGVCLYFGNSFVILSDLKTGVDTWLYGLAGWMLLLIGMSFLGYSILVQSDIGKLNFDILPAYDADDGDLTNDQIEAIRKVVPQRNFKLAKSLFGEE